jgi:hypothetical protein
MLETTRDADHYFVQSTFRRGVAQNNVVRRTLGEIVARGDDRELEGFCAVLTENCAITNDSGRYSEIFGKYAKRRERVMRRRYQGARAGRD